MALRVGFAGLAALVALWAVGALDPAPVSGASRGPDTALPPGLGVVLGVERDLRAIVDDIVTTPANVEAHVAALSARAIVLQAVLEELAESRPAGAALTSRIDALRRTTDSVARQLAYVVAAATIRDTEALHAGMAHLLASLPRLEGQLALIRRWSAPGEAVSGSRRGAGA